MARARRACDVLLVVLFLAALCLPLLGVRLGRHGWDIATRAENRRLEPEPTLLRLKQARVTSAAGLLKAIAKFPGEFKYYFSSHFGFRSLLIRDHGLLLVKGLGVTSNPDVILGKQDWLYMASEGSLDDWRNVDPFTPAELEQWRQMLEVRHAYCASRGIPYLLVIAPSKYDVYPEYMPERLSRVGNVCRLDQLLAYLHERHSPVRVLDLRGPLLGAKAFGRVFQKTDTHWNDRGGWVAYEQIIAALRPSVPSLRQLPAGDFAPVTTDRPGMDLAGLLGLNDVLREQSLDLRPLAPLRLAHVEQNDVEPITVNPRAPGQPSVVMFRDSFMTNVLPFVAESFGRGVYFWEDGFDRQVIEAERPTVVIQELAQRKLMRPAGEMEITQHVRLVHGRWILVPPAAGGGSKS